MAAQSPSPVKTITSSSGRANFTPVAKAKARPWVVCRVSNFIYPGARLEQPIPDTTAVLKGSRSWRCIARSTEPRIMPWPHPAHQIWGSFSILVYLVNNSFTAILFHLLNLGQYFIGGDEFGIYPVQAVYTSLAASTALNFQNN